MQRLALFTTAAAAALATVVANPTAQAQQTSAQDTVTYQENVPNSGLIVSGTILLGATYGASAFVATRSDRTEDSSLFVPIAGPWMDLADRRECRGCTGEATNKVLLVASGVGQAVGALQIVGGFLFPAKRTVTRVGRVHLAPQVGLGRAGLSAYGTF
ncbi:hypothetical protein [Sorangium sp. So ce1000]|uniref:hypothetical protein n=1 Tax=Sorangium sp. So ce1000 TaxID=3133325 RepID=UPI003F5EEB93